MIGTLEIGQSLTRLIKNNSCSVATDVLQNSNIVIIVPNKNQGQSLNCQRYGVTAVQYVRIKCNSHPSFREQPLLFKFKKRLTGIN